MNLWRAALKILYLLFRPRTPPYVRFWYEPMQSSPENILSPREKKLIVCCVYKSIVDQKSVRIPYFLPHQNCITRARKRIATVKGVTAQHSEYGLLSSAIHDWIDCVRWKAIFINQAMNRWMDLSYTGRMLSTLPLLNPEKKIISL